MKKIIHNRVHICNSVFFKYICFLLCALLVAGMAPKVTRAEGRTIRVGQYDYPGMIDIDDNGGYSGYAVDYLNEIADYTGWEYEYVSDDWDSLLERLENGDIDLICTAQYSLERDEVFDYADEPLGYESSKLYSRIDDERFFTMILMPLME